jgi:hypothetical protein
MDELAIVLTVEAAILLRKLAELSRALAQDLRSRYPDDSHSLDFAARAEKHAEELEIQARSYDSKHADKGLAGFSAHLL